ncbi:hypothetical protein QMA02_31535 [Bacillus wiedmannii]|nr:hypothetical protein [Bacillus wiedmannii]MDI6680274.1 hypothetical protein [Bacillus wiedmannii]
MRKCILGKINIKNEKTGGSAGTIASPSRGTEPRFWSVWLGES